MLGSDNLLIGSGNFVIGSDNVVNSSISYVNNQPLLNPIEVKRTQPVISAQISEPVTSSSL